MATYNPKKLSFFGVNNSRNVWVYSGAVTLSQILSTTTPFITDAEARGIIVDDIVMFGDLATVVSAINGGALLIV